RLEHGGPDRRERPRVAGVADQARRRQPLVVAVVRPVLVGLLEKEPERPAQDRHEDDFGPGGPDRRFTSAAPDPAVRHKDVKRPRDRRGPRPERLYARKDSRFGDKDYQRAYPGIARQ